MSYALLRSQRGTTTIVSQQSELYINMIRSNNYVELFTGTRDECKAEEENYKEELDNAFGGLAD